MNEWREQYAATLDRFIGELGKALVEAENAEDVLEQRGDQRGLDVTRAFTAALRSQINDMSSQARELRANHQPAPLPLTVRYTRP